MGEEGGTSIGTPAGVMGPKLKLREQFEEISPTNKNRPTTPAPTHENLEDQRLKKSFKLKNLDQLKNLIYLLNLKYGVGSAKDIGVSLKLRNKLPSENFKTKKDFLAQLRKTLLRSPQMDSE